MTRAASGAVTVEPVESREDLDRFVHLPWRIYQGNPAWVPPLLIDVRTRLSPKKNPFFQHAEAACFLARRAGRVVGRVSASVDRNYNAFWNETAGAFGWFECEDDGEAARALLDAARAWLHARGVTVMRGPLSFSTNDECGLLVDGFDRPPAVMMPYNPPYYAALLTGAGLRKTKDLHAWWLASDQPAPTRIRRMAEIARDRRAVRVRGLDMKHFPDEVERIKGVYNAAWERNWGFVPLTDAEFAHMAKDLKLGVDPRMVLLAEVNGETVGSAVVLPDLNQAIRHANGRLLPFGLLKILWHKRRVRTLRMLTLGVVERWRRRGIEATLMVEALDRAGRFGYAGGELGWTLEDNRLITDPIQEMGGVRTKTYRIYEAAVHSGP